MDGFLHGHPDVGRLVLADGQNTELGLGAISLRLSEITWLPAPHTRFRVETGQLMFAQGQDLK